MAVSAIVLPMTCMAVQVFIQEHKACEVSLMTHSVTCFITSLPFLLLLPCLVAIVIIPLCGLNSSGATSHCCFAMVHVYWQGDDWPTIQDNSSQMLA